MSEHTGEVVELDTTTQHWLRQYSETTAAIKFLEDQRARAREHLEHALGEAELGTIDGREAIRWTIVHSHRIDMKKLRAEWPHVAEQYVVPTVTRRFTVPGGDE